MDSSINHMWSLPLFRSAADAPRAPCEERPDVGRSARRPHIEILAQDPYIFRLIPWLDPLERLPCDGLVLQRPARCPAAGRSEAENRRKIDLPAEARSVTSRPLMNVTITG